MKKQDILYYVVGALVIICGIWLAVKLLKAGIGLLGGLLYALAPVIVILGVIYYFYKKKK